MLLAILGSLYALIPLNSTVQIGSDEGFELAKATLCIHGHGLYAEIWNDQPPLHTFLLVQVLKHISPAVLLPRLMTVCFAAMLLASLHVLVVRVSGRMAGFISILLLMFCPGFLELSSSCMLEMPSLATGVAALSVLLVMRRDGWRLREVLAGVLFASALQMKLVPMYLLPLIAFAFLGGGPASKRPWTSLEGMRGPAGARSSDCRLSGLVWFGAAFSVQFSSSANPGDYPSIRYVWRKSFDPVGTFRSGQTLKASGSALISYYLQNGQRVYQAPRWGDFGTVTVDPVDGTFWGSHEYVHSSNGDDWGTWWNQIYFP